MWRSVRPVLCDGYLFGDGYLFSKAAAGVPIDMLAGAGSADNSIEAVAK